MATDKIDALVIFGATGDLAKLETFPALVGLVKRGVLDVPVIGVAKSGWRLEQFRDYGSPTSRSGSAPTADLFGIEPVAPANMVIFRIWPETGVSYTLQGKKPGAGWEPLPESMSFAGQPGSDIRLYDRLIGAALDGERWLFARQDTVEAMWTIVDPVLGNATPVHPYPQGSWGPKEADRLLPGRVTWHDPVG